MPIPLSELRRQQDLRRSVTPISIPTDFKLSIPTNVVATGKEGFIRIQWSPIDGSDGYDVVVSSAANLDSPSYGQARIAGPKATWYDFHVGNAASTYFFGVRSWQGFPPRYFSDFSAAVSATSISTTTVGTGAPAPPSTPPSTIEQPPTGKGEGSPRLERTTS